MFQPCTGTARHLGSVANYKFYSYSAAPPVSTNFLDLTFPPSLLYRFPISSIFPCISYLLYLLITFSPGTKCRPPGCHPHPPPASLRLFSLCPTPCACLCAVSCDCETPHFLTSDFSQIPVSPWGVLSSWFPLLLFEPASYYLSALPYPGIFLWLVLCQVDFGARTRGQNISNP